MAMRSTGSITVAFGLVSIPVKLYSATTEAESIKFNMIAPSGARVKTQLLDSRTGEVVTKEQVRKGYEFAKDQYVTFAAEELKAMAAVGSHTAELVEFVPAESVDGVYFDKPYYLAPDQAGAKPYALLAQVLRASGRVAIGRWAANGKQKLVMIRATERGLVMQQLLYSTEVRTMAELEIPPAAVSDAELRLAMQLVDALKGEAWNPDAYVDEVAVRVRDAIDKKVKGEAFTIDDAPRPTAQVIDMTAMLQASLESKGAGLKGRAIAEAAPKKAKARKTA